MISASFSNDTLLAVIYLSSFYLLFNKEEYRALILKLLIIKGVLFLALAPLEIYAMGKENVSELQFSGGQYYNIGVLILVAILGENRLNKKWRGILVLLLYVTILISFSRGALLILPLVLLSTLRLGRKVVPLIVILGIVVLNKLENSFFLEYWRLRLNLADGIESMFTSSSRSDIIGVYRDNVDLFHFLFGYGIGGIKNFMMDATDGVMQFGSLHNFFFNSIGEIGILVFSSLLILVFLRLQRYSKRGVLLMFTFLLFGLTTGLELVNMSRNFSMDIFLLILLL